jgi:hypothetical protein
MGLSSMTCSRFSGPMIAEKFQFSGMRCWKSSAAKSTPEAAEVCSTHRQVVDPYGVYPDPSAECDCIGGFNFARAPGTGLWIEFGDLPEATREALRVRDDESRI